MNENYLQQLAGCLDLAFGISAKRKTTTREATCDASSTGKGQRDMQKPTEHDREREGQSMSVHADEISRDIQHNGK